MNDSSIKVFVPEAFSSEITYVYKVLLNVILGLDFDVVELADSKLSYILVNNKKIIIRNSFWRVDDGELYSQKNIPEDIKEISTEYSLSKSLIYLYGSSELKKNADSIIINADLIGSAFFFLTRWEENVSLVKDKYGRFPEGRSFAIKHNINLRPVVNEYSYFLKSILLSFGLNPDLFKEGDFTVIPTHDIDSLVKFKNLFSFIKSFFAGLIKHRSLTLGVRVFKQYFEMLFKHVDDPYFTYDYLNSLANKNGLKSYYFLIPSKQGDRYSTYDIRSKAANKALSEIKKGNNTIGIHTSLLSAFDENKFKDEFSLFTEVESKSKVIRNHFLKYKFPYSWCVSEKYQIEKDFGMCYHSHLGFRAGITCQYPAFDYEAKVELKLQIVPTVLMDQALIRTTNSVDEAIVMVQKLKSIVRDYNGVFCFLWHPQNINVFPWNNFSQKILPILYQEEF